MGYFWSEEEINFLQKNYRKMTLEQLSKRLNRSLSGTKMKISNLGLNSQQVLKRKCLHCSKEFETRDITKKYCCKECRYEEMKIRQHDYFQKYKKEINRKRAKKREQLINKREQLIASNKKKNSLTAFFELYCLSLDANQGIKKIKSFTHREDAERIYRLLRANFMKTKFI